METSANISRWVLQTIEKGFMGVFSAEVAPPAGSGNGTRSESSVRERGHRIWTSLHQGNWVYSRYFTVQKKDGGLRPILDLRVLKDSAMQLKFKINFETNRATDQIRGLVCHDRYQGCILPHIHPSVSQEVPEVLFWGQSMPVSGSSVQPNIITLYIHEMRR